MRFGTRAKVTMIVGLAISCIFLVLGIRQIGRPSKPVTIADATPAAPAQPAVMLPLATANRPIAVGETITAALISTRPGNALQNQTIASPAEVIGKVALKPIAPNVPIDRTMFDTESKLAVRVPVGMRAMSIDTTAEIAVAGLIRPGDRVDVQVVYPGEDAISGTRGQGRSHAETLLQLVPILAVGDLVIGTPPAPPPGDGSANGNTTTTSAQPPQPARTVTLALTPEQVSTLSLAKNIGGLYLSLRNPTDQAVAAVAPPRPVAAPVVRTAAAARPVRRAARAQGGQSIELVIGGRSQTIQSGSADK
jgi:pilus assembly protein CpaB